MRESVAPRGLSALFQPIDLTEGACWKTILRFSFPIILSYLLQQVYSISDAAIVGQTLSAEEVAGVNDIAPIVNIFLQFAFGVSAGFCVITSCNVGSHNQPGVRRSLATQIVLSSVLTVLLTGLALLLLNPMLAWINVAKDSGAVYTSAKARNVVLEMADSLSLDLVDKKLVTDQLVLTVGYDTESLTDKDIREKYQGKVSTDRYGRQVPAHAHGTVNMERPTSSGKILTEKVGGLFDRIVNRDLLVRRITLSANHLVYETNIQPNNKAVQLDLFTDYEKLEKERKAEEEVLARERRRQEAVLKIKKKFGKNAILKGLNYADGATQKERNQQIGGHHE